MKTVFFGFAFCSINAEVWADELCASSSDLAALQVAAVQQELMVGALACNNAHSYNAFVVTYQKELQASDKNLQSFFIRMGSETGSYEYDAYKTKLANTYSLRSSRNLPGFCRLTRVVFGTALNEGKRSLTEFALAQPVPFFAQYQACGESVAGDAMTAQTSVAATRRSGAQNNNLYVAPRSERPSQTVQPSVRESYSRSYNGKLYGGADRNQRSYRYGEPYRSQPYSYFYSYGASPGTYYPYYWYGAQPRFYDLRRR